MSFLAIENAFDWNWKECDGCRKKRHIRELDQIEHEFKDLHGNVRLVVQSNYCKGNTVCKDLARAYIFDDEERRRRKKEKEIKNKPINSRFDILDL